MSFHNLSDSPIRTFPLSSVDYYYGSRLKFLWLVIEEMARAWGSVGTESLVVKLQFSKSAIIGILHVNMRSPV